MIRLPAIALVLLVLCSQSANADRYYGNISMGYSKQFESEGVPGWTQQQQQLALSYEDVLFYKNRMRLGLNFYRTQRPQSDRYDTRPIYSFDLSSYGYSLRFSYSPYKRWYSESLGEFERFDYPVYSRESRASVSLLYPKFPTFTFTYASRRNFDREVGRRIDTKNENILAQSGYTMGPVAASLSYNRIDQVNHLAIASDRQLESFTAATNVSQNLAGWATVSAGYSYYDTKSQLPSAQNATLNTDAQSVTLFANSRRIYNVAAFASYSGRFFNSSSNAREYDNSNQTLSGQIGFYPASYASFELLKSYQISDESGEYQPLEYLSFTTNLTRYLRRGVNTRLSYTRLIYQQFERDESDLRSNSDNQTADTYYGSLGFRMLRSIRLFLDMSVSHSSLSLNPDLRYQVQRMVTAQFTISSTIEGRVTANWTYAGPEFRPFSSYALNYNAGVTWTPNTALNATVSYNYHDTRAGNDQTFSSLGGYLGYSYRRAFSLSATVNQQYQERTITTPENPSAVWTTRPKNVNTYLTIYVTKQLNTSIGYTWNSTPRFSGEDLNSSTLTANAVYRF